MKNSKSSQRLYPIFSSIGYLSLLGIIPAIVLLLNRLGFAPPNVHSNFGDPDYGYYLNSLLIVDGKAPFHIDHPGTFIQLIGAFVIQLKHFMQDGPSDIIDFALLNAYENMFLASFVLAFLLAVSIFVFGIVLLRKGYPFWIILFSQATPFLLIDTWIYLSRLAAEVFVVTVSVWIGALLVYKQESLRFEIKNSILFGIFLGIGLATKINFLPISALLLLSATPMAFLAGVLATVAAFATTTSVIWPQYWRLFGWLVNIFSHRDHYGHGGAGVLPQIQTLKENFIYLLQFSQPYFFLLSLVPAFLFLQWTIKRREKQILIKEVLLVSLAFIQLILVLKHIAPRYLLPTLAVWLWLIPNLLKSSSRRDLPSQVRVMPIVMVILVYGACLSQGYQRWKQETNGYTYSEAEIKKFWKLMEKYDHCDKIFSSPLPRREFSLYSGDLAANGAFTVRLQRLFPNTLFYDPYPSHFRSFSEVIALLEVRKKYEDSKCVLLVGSKDVLEEEKTFLMGTRRTSLGRIIAPFKLTPIFEIYSIGAFKIERFLD